MSEHTKFAWQTVMDRYVEENHHEPDLSVWGADREEFWTAVEAELFLRLSEIMLDAMKKPLAQNMALLESVFAEAKELHRQARAALDAATDAASTNVRPIVPDLPRTA